jgi:hypothetical protein
MDIGLPFLQVLPKATKRIADHTDEEHAKRRCDQAQNP